MIIWLCPVDEVAAHEADVLDPSNLYRMQLENVHKAYAGPRNTKCQREQPKVAVKDMTLGVAAGECFGLLGVNGAGKTSVLKCLAGEQRASSGTLTVDGMDTTTEREAVNKNIG